MKQHPEAVHKANLVANQSGGGPAIRPQEESIKPSDEATRGRISLKEWTWKRVHARRWGYKKGRETVVGQLRGVLLEV